MTLGRGGGTTLPLGIGDGIEDNLPHPAAGKVAAGFTQIGLPRDLEERNLEGVKDLDTQLVMMSPVRTVIETPKRSQEQQIADTARPRMDPASKTILSKVEQVGTCSLGIGTPTG